MRVRVNADEISARLDLSAVKHLQVILDRYTGAGSGDPRVDNVQMTLVALKAALAEILAQNNRVLWDAVQRESENSNQT